jgi:hypothetical protein
MKTVEAYTEWMKAFGSITAPGFAIAVHSTSFDEDNKTYTYVAPFVKHTGEGGHVPPTNKEMHTEYVCIVKLNDNGRVKTVKKIWNDTYAMKQFGWM